MKKLICRKCGKEIKGTMLMYPFSGEWECSKCNKKNILCCESGSKVLISNLENRYTSDSELAKRYLSSGESYTVKNLEIGGYSSRIILEEFPNISFNAVLFERCE